MDVYKINGHRLVFEHFPNGETKVPDFREWLRTDGNNVLEYNYNGDGSLMQLALVKGHFDYCKAPCKLLLYHMPYDRMDRKVKGSAYTLKDVAKYINGLRFVEVIIVEPHSDKTLKLVKRSRAVYPAQDLLPIVLEKIGPVVYVALPDNGALQRYGNGVKQPLLFKKRRDEVTNELIEMKLVQGRVQSGGIYVIVDDVCAKGDTLAEAAATLRSQGAAKVYALTTSCQSTVFDGRLLKGNLLDGLFTTKISISRQHQKILYVENRLTEEWNDLLCSYING